MCICHRYNYKCGHKETQRARCGKEPNCDKLWFPLTSLDEDCSLCDTRVPVKGSESFTKLQTEKPSVSPIVNDSTSLLVRNDALLRKKGITSKIDLNKPDIKQQEAINNEFLARRAKRRSFDLVLSRTISYAEYGHAYEAHREALKLLKQNKLISSDVSAENNGDIERIKAENAILREALQSSERVRESTITTLKLIQGATTQAEKEIKRLRKANAVVSTYTSQGTQYSVPSTTPPRSPRRPNDKTENSSRTPPGTDGQLSISPPGAPLRPCRRRNVPFETDAPQQPVFTFTPLGYMVSPGSSILPWLDQNSNDVVYPTLDSSFETMGETHCLGNIDDAEDDEPTNSGPVRLEPANSVDIILRPTTPESGSLEPGNLDNTGVSAELLVQYRKQLRAQNDGMPTRGNVCYPSPEPEVPLYSEERGGLVSLKSELGLRYLHNIRTWLAMPEHWNPLQMLRYAERNRQLFRHVIPSGNVPLRSLKIDSSKMKKDIPELCHTRSTRPRAMETRADFIGAWYTLDWLELCRGPMELNLPLFTSAFDSDDTEDSEDESEESEEVEQDVIETWTETEGGLSPSEDEPVSPLSDSLMPGDERSPSSTSPPSPVSPAFSGPAAGSVLSRRDVDNEASLEESEFNLVPSNSLEGQTLLADLRYYLDLPDNYDIDNIQAWVDNNSAKLEQVRDGLISLPIKFQPIPYNEAALQEIAWDKLCNAVELLDWSKTKYMWPVSE